MFSSKAIFSSIAILSVVVGIFFFNKDLKRRGAVATEGIFPNQTWEYRYPEKVGLDSNQLEHLSKHLGGKGAVVRYGYMVHTWGDYTKASDIASAAKPIYTMLLLKAVQEGFLNNVDEKVSKYQSCLRTLNADLNYKDRKITFRHLANQISGYGITEKPGEAFIYSDWQMALFVDTLFLNVYDAPTWDDVDATVLQTYLGNVLQFQDAPTMLAFGLEDRPGRIAMSIRDFARFGLLFMRQGNWQGKQVISAKQVQKVTNSPISNAIPETNEIEAEICPQQRSIGSKAPVNESPTNSMANYSWMWWINYVNRLEKKTWPDAPQDTYLACGHQNFDYWNIGEQNCQRALVIIPSQDLIVVWNDINLELNTQPKTTINDILKLLMQAINS